MRVNGIVVFFLVGAGAVSPACSGSSTTPPATSSGLARSTTVLTLTSNELGQLCDWSGARQGGYGSSVPCPDGGSAGPYADRMTCVDDVGFYSTSCPTLTVGDYEDCINDLAADRCGIATNDGCAALRGCLAQQVP